MLVEINVDVHVMLGTDGKNMSFKGFHSSLFGFLLKNMSYCIAYLVVYPPPFWL